MSTYTLEDLVTATGYKRRAIQMWAEAGALLASDNTDGAGTGTHRRFSSEEMFMATYLTPLARLGMPIAKLVHASEAIRAVEIDLDHDSFLLLTWTGSWFGAMTARDLQSLSAARIGQAEAGIVIFLRAR